MTPVASETHPPLWLELATLLLVPAAAIGFSRVFADTEPLLPIAGAALLSSAVAVLCRRVGLPLLVAAVISTGLLGILIMNRYAPGTARLGVLPSGATIDELQRQIDELIRNFRELQTPVPALEPFVAAAMVGTWIMAFLTDWGALRLRLAFEPILPSALLFVFTSIPPVSAGQNRVLATIVFGGAVALWAVAQRVASIGDRGVWLSNDRERGPSAVARTALAMAAVAVIAGSFIGGRLPGADAEPVYSFADNENSTRLVVSPYVRLHSRLVEQTDQLLFTVDAPEPAYWRIAGLDSYEDNIWKLAGDFSPEDNDLPSTSELGGQRTELLQTFRINALAAIWLPAALAPTEIVDSTAGVTWHADTSSLTVDGSTPSGDGVVYTVKSLVASFDAGELNAAPDVVPANIAEKYLDVPTLPAVVRQTAQDVTQGEGTRYGQMLALQEYFRSEFDYSTDLPPVTGDPISQFLADRQGFCQQFAGTFALMARQLGAPARVATGFTWGEATGSADDGRTTYQVTGAQTHAWPEVYFSGLGWVPFEPTPGRGIPNAAYTGYEPAQASEEQPSLEPEDVALPPTTLPSQQEAPAPTFEDVEPVGAGEEAGFSIPLRTVLPLLAIIGYLIGMPLLHVLMRNRRRSRAKTGAETVEVAWAEASEALNLGFDVERSPSETRSEFANRLKQDRTAGADQMVDLAELATAARFSPAGVDDEGVERADRLAEAVETSTRERVPGYLWLARQLNPLTVPGLGRRRKVVSANREARPASAPEQVVDDVAYEANTGSDRDLAVTGPRH